MDIQKEDLVPLPKGNITRLHLLFLLINLVLPIILDQFAVVRDVLQSSIISTLVNPNLFELNPTYNYSISMIVSIVLAALYAVVAVVISIVKSFDRNFLNVTAILAAIFYLLFFIVFLFQPLEGWQLYVMYIAFLGRYFLAIGGILYLILLLRQAKQAVQGLTKEA